MKKIFFFLFLNILLKSQDNSLFIDGVAAVVEDKIVLKSDLNQMVNMMAIQQNINPNENINRFIKLRSFVLESMIDQKILLEMAEEDTTIEFSEKEVDQALDQQINNILMQAGGEKEAEKMLGQSIKSFRSEFWYDMKDKIISEKYQQKLLSKIKISKKDVLSFFNTYVDSLPMFPTEAKIRHLLIKPTPSDSVKKETVFILNNIKDKINNGEDFSFFAEEYSMDPGSKNNGGNLGWVKRGSLLKEFEEVTFTIKEKTISDPIETDVGFHILEVFERKGDRARVRHILISPQIQKRDEEIAFKFAKTIKDSCKNIQDFKKFVKEYSKDYQTSSIGGDLGWIIPNQYPIKEIGLALNYINIGECSPPINTSYGFHLLWLEKIKTGGKANLKDHWPKIELMALNNKKMAWYNSWIKKIKENKYIKISG
ncbi:MAG: peptidylprolyl isomerase [Candidatus Neomarinimicrobiota bacterium]